MNEEDPFDFENKRTIICNVNGEYYIADVVEIDGDIIKIHNKCNGTCKEHHIDVVKPNGFFYIYSEKFKWFEKIDWIYKLVRKFKKWRMKNDIINN